MNKCIHSFCSNFFFFFGSIYISYYVYLGIWIRQNLPKFSDEKQIIEPTRTCLIVNGKIFLLSLSTKFFFSLPSYFTSIFLAFMKPSKGVCHDATATPFALCCWPIDLLTRALLEGSHLCPWILTDGKTFH